MSSPRIRVAVIEDHSETREDIVKWLGLAPDITCTGAYSSAEEAEREIPQNLPDVALVDINLPGKSGIHCVFNLKRSLRKIEFVMLTTYDSNDMIFNAIRVGASGYLLKRSVAENLVPAIREVHAGGAPMSAAIARKVVAHIHKMGKPAEELSALTKRESEILLLLSTGLTYKQIAVQLCISTGTVHRHLHAIYAKLHVQSGKEAMAKVFGK